MVFDVEVFRSFMVFWATGDLEGSLVLDSKIDVWDIKPIFQKSLCITECCGSLCPTPVARGPAATIWRHYLAVIKSTYPPMAKPHRRFSKFKAKVSLSS